MPLIYTSQSEEVEESTFDLSQLLAVIRRRALVIVGVTTAVASTTLALALISTPTYKAKFQLLIKPVTVENKLTSSSSPLSQEKATQPAVGLDETELRVLQSPKLMAPIIKQINAQYPGTGALDLNLKSIKNTNILEVSYQAPDPKKVQFVLDVVAQAYLTYSLEERQADVRQGIQFVDNQLPSLQQRVEILQARLEKFRQRYDLIDPDIQGKQLSNQLSQILQQRLDTQTQLAKTRALYATLQSQLGQRPNQAMVASALSEAPRYQKLLNQLQELESNIALKSAQFREDTPIVQNLRTQRQNLLPLVQQEAKRVLGNKLSSTIVDPQGLASSNSIRLQQTQQFLDADKQIQALEAQKQALTQAESFLRQQVKQFPIIAGQNDDLERQLKIAAENLNQFLTKREALRIDIAAKLVPWQLISPPTKPKPPFSIKTVLILGGALGLLSGITAALLVDKLNNIFYSLEEVKDTTRLPLLGEIPFKQKHASHFWESLRSLYTNIHFLSFDASIRSVAIISASPEDGRSTIAVHLAQTAAAMGQRVLLVDADLRRPKIHTMLNLPNAQGLSNIIAEELNFQDVIQQTRSVSVKAQDDRLYKATSKEIESPLEHKFSVLTAGQIPPNPISLLSSRKMQSLAEQFQAAFDFVIYDTSPLFGLADSSILAIHTDASLLVVGLGKTNRSALAKVLEGLKISCTPVLGVVANGVKGYAARS